LLHEAWNNKASTDIPVEAISPKTVSASFIAVKEYFITDWKGSFLDFGTDLLVMGAAWVNPRDDPVAMILSIP
jgi:hypothetical protein